MGFRHLNDGLPGYDRWKTQTPEEYYGEDPDDDEEREDPEDDGEDEPEEVDEQDEDIDF